MQVRFLLVELTQGVPHASCRPTHCCIAQEAANKWPGALSTFQSKSELSTGLFGGLGCCCTCRWLGVPALSDRLVEELDPATSDLTQLDSIGTVQLPQLRALLSSHAFAAAAFSIAAAHATAVPALRQLDLGSVTRLCAAAGQGGRLRFVRKLSTKVVLRGSKEDVTRNSAAREVGCQLIQLVVRT